MSVSAALRSGRMVSAGAGQECLQHVSAFDIPAAAISTLACASARRCHPGCGGLITILLPSLPPLLRNLSAPKRTAAAAHQEVRLILMGNAVFPREMSAVVEDLSRFPHRP